VCVCVNRMTFTDKSLTCGLMIAITLSIRTAAGSDVLLCL